MKFIRARLCKLDFDRLHSALLVVIFLFVAISYFQLGRQYLSERKLSGSSFGIGAGEIDSLPPEVIAMKKMADLKGIESFQLVDVFVKHWLIFQRAVEFLYPARLDPSSPYIFADVLFEAPSNCLEVEKLEGIILYECK